MNKETDLILESLKANGTHEMDLPCIEVKGESITIDGSLSVGDLRIIVSELDKQKPRTKTEFVQQGFHNCHEAMFKHEMEEELYISSHNGFIVASMSNIIDNWRTELYRKVETEIDERQEFIDAAIELLNQNSHDHEATHYKEWFGAMFDSGKFKLVEK